MNGELAGHGEWDRHQGRPLWADAGRAGLPLRSSASDYFPQRQGRPVGRPYYQLRPGAVGLHSSPRRSDNRLSGPWACRERLPFGQVCFRTSRAPGKVGGLRSGPHSARRPIDRTQQGGGGNGAGLWPAPLVLAAHQRLLPPFPPTNAYRPQAAPAGRPV